MVVLQFCDDNNGSGVRTCLINTGGGTKLVSVANGHDIPPMVMDGGGSGGNDISVNK